MTRRPGPTRARRPPSRSPERATGAAVTVAVRDAVAWITLERPALGNRLDADVLGGLVDACEAAEDDEQVRVVVLGARGRVFCAGLPRGVAWPDRAWGDGIGAVARLTKPTVAVLQGDARGWGLALALACDLRIATATATLSVPDVEQGRLPGGGLIPRLVRMAGIARTLDLVLLGTRLPAARAAEWGLVTTVVEAAQLAGAATSMASALATRAPLALRLAKEAVVQGLDLPLADGIRLEQDLYVLLQTSVDRREGIRAFLERRTPRFGGR